MPDPEILTESQPHLIDLSRAEAAALSQLGRRLASTTSWWGQTDLDDFERTLIRLRPHASGQWEIRVHDAVGAVSAGGRRFIVQPKITQAHLLHLLDQSRLLPRVDDQHVALGASTSLWELVARWFVTASEAVLRRDLIKDYRPLEDLLPYVRGRVQPLPTATALLKGRVAITCEYDEFDADTPLNRLLRTAAHTVSANSLLHDDTRRRARRLTLRLDGISPLQPADLRAHLDRRTAHYADAVTLARSIIHGSGSSLQPGAQPAWSFLIRTPELVEAGIREILANGLQDLCTVTKRGLQLEGSTKTLNPDLVFAGGCATGDVKYKRTGNDWDTGDLYQAVAFATGYRTRHALVISFANDERALPTVHVGDVTVTNLTWRAESNVTADAAANQLVDDVRRWWQALSRYGGEVPSQGNQGPGGRTDRQRDGRGGRSPQNSG